MTRQAITILMESDEDDDDEADAMRSAAFCSSQDGIGGGCLNESGLI